MKDKTLLLSLSLVALVLMVFFGGYFLKNALQKKRLPVYGQVASFTLKDQNGKVFSSKVLQGKVWIADFFFTTCSDICPLLSKNMAKLSRTFEEVPGVKLVSFTVNPENDTPSVLKAYAAKLQKGKDNWYFLTGDRSEIRHVALDIFKVGSVKEPVFHSSRFPLVDRNGLIRGYYDGTNQDDVNQLFKDVSQLVKERF